MARSRSERGAALPFVLVVTAAMVVLVADLDLRSKLAFDRARRATQMTEARSLLAKLEEALSRLENDKFLDLSGEDREFDVGDMRVTLRLSAAESRINIGRLNDLIVSDPVQRLFRALLRRERLEFRAFACAMDWVDADDEPMPNGAERPDYSGEDYSPRNGPFETVDELSFVRGFQDPSAFDRIRPLLTTFGSGRIYLPAADEKIIDLFADAFGPIVRSRLEDVRRNPSRTLDIPAGSLPEKDMQALQLVLSSSPTAWMVTITLASRNFSQRASYVLSLSESAGSPHRLLRIG